MSKKDIFTIKPEVPKEKKNQKFEQELLKFNAEIKKLSEEIGMPVNALYEIIRETYREDSEIDIRDLDRCPGHVGKFNGLHYLVKKALLNPTKHGDNTSEVEGNANSEIIMDNDEQVDSPTTNSSQSPMRIRANQIADEVIKILVESIDEGGLSCPRRP